MWGLDHHCGFFNKCVAGYQKYAFYLFIISVFIGFVQVLVYLGMAVDVWDKSIKFYYLYDN